MRWRRTGYSSRGLLQLRVLDLATLRSHDVVLPEAVGHVEFDMNKNPAAQVIRFTYSAPLTLPTTFEYNFATRYDFTALRATTEA